MSEIMMQCKQCGSIFSTGIAISGNSTIHLQGNTSRCPYCGSVEQVPDGTFRSTLNGIVKILANSPDPIQTVKQVIHDLEQAKKEHKIDSLKKSEALTAFQQWIPNSPEKLAAYIAIFYTIYLLLLEKPVQNIEYNQTFINQYNQVIIERPESNIDNGRKTFIRPDKKVGRNDPCPCGSGLKYKKCCLDDRV